MDAKKLESMKYNELQKLAKQNGIKANMKVSFNTISQTYRIYDCHHHDGMYVRSP